MFSSSSPVGGVGLGVSFGAGAGACVGFSPGTLHYLLSSCTYGGCMEDEMDAETLGAFLKIFCPPELMGEEEKKVVLDPEGVYHTGELEDHENMMRSERRLIRTCSTCGPLKNNFFCKIVTKGT